MSANSTTQTSNQYKNPLLDWPKLTAYLTPYTPENAAHFAAIFKAKFPELAARVNGRLERATEIASKTQAIRATDAVNVYWVKSETNKNPLAGYIVDLNTRSCTCPDSGNGNVCKHRIAVALHIYAPAWQMETYLAETAAQEAARPQLTDEQDKTRSTMANFKFFMAEHREKLFRLRQTEADAWQEANRHIDAYIDAGQVIEPDGTFKNCDDLRAAMIEATERANHATDLVQRQIEYINFIAADFSK